MKFGYLIILNLILYSGVCQAATCPETNLGFESLIEANSNLSDHVARATCDVTQSFFILKNPNQASAALGKYLGDAAVQDKCKALKKEDTTKLAKLVTGVAQCFEIDPFIFAGIVEHESRFDKRARSPTGAVGLTQLTCVALNENDRLVGINPGALPQTQDYFNRITKGSENSSQKSCIEKLMSRVNGDRNPQYRHLEERGIKSDSAKKRELVEQKLTALVSGAILLKQKLSEESRREVLSLKLSNQNTKFDNLSNASKWKVYRKALYSYNGERGTKHEIYNLPSGQTLEQAKRQIKGFFAKEDRARVSLSVSRDKKVVKFSADARYFYASMVIRNALNMQNRFKH